MGVVVVSCGGGKQLREGIGKDTSSMNPKFGETISDRMIKDVVDKAVKQKELSLFPRL